MKKLNQQNKSTNLQQKLQNHKFNNKLFNNHFQKNNHISNKKINLFLIKKEFIYSFIFFLFH